MRDPLRLLPGAPLVEVTLSQSVPSGTPSYVLPLRRKKIPDFEHLFDTRLFLSVEGRKEVNARLSHILNSSENSMTFYCFVRQRVSPCGARGRTEIHS